MSDQGLGVTGPEMDLVRRQMKSLAKTGEEWEHYLMVQIKGVADLQREMQAHMARLTAQAETNVRVGEGYPSARPPLPVMTHAAQ